MKGRIAIFTFVGALIALVGACDDGGDYGYRGPRGRIACGQLTTCDVCTPVLGCGWCQLASGGGICTDGPDDCPPPPLASWTWEPVGCHHDGGIAADASVGSHPPPAADASTTLDANTPSDASLADSTLPKDAAGE
jgi:hypothetical protein